MAGKIKDPLFIFSNGRVASVNKLSGEIIWEIRLKQYLGLKNMTFGTIVQEDEKLFIGTGGYLICLSAKDGSLIWKNELKGWGYGFVSMGQNADVAAAAALAQHRAAAAG